MLGKSFDFLQKAVFALTEPHISFHTRNFYICMIYIYIVYEALFSHVADIHHIYRKLSIKLRSGLFPPGI